MTWEQVLEVEDRANRYIWENHLFRAYYPTPEELAVLPYRSKKALEGPVRLTEFPGADLCACCGTHVAASGQVGSVKFLSCQKLRDGVRLELLCGAVVEPDDPIYSIDPTEEALAACMRRSTFQTKLDLPGEEARLVTLSTCSYEFEDARYIVIGVLTPLEETVKN